MASKNKVAALRESVTVFVVTAGPRSWHESRLICAELRGCRVVGESEKLSRSEGQLTKYMA